MTVWASETSTLSLPAAVSRPIRIHGHAWTVSVVPGQAGFPAGHWGLLAEGVAHP